MRSPDDVIPEEGLSRPNSAAGKLQWRLIAGLLAGGNGRVASSVAQAFEDKRAIGIAQARLRCHRQPKSPSSTSSRA